MLINVKQFNKEILMALLVGFIGLLASQSAFAVGNMEENEKFRDLAIQHAEEAITHAKQGHADQTVEHTEAAISNTSEIYSQMWSGKLGRVNSRLRNASNAAKKGEFDKSTQLLEEAVGILKTLKN